MLDQIRYLPVLNALWQLSYLFRDFMIEEGNAFKAKLGSIKCGQFFLYFLNVSYHQSGDQTLTRCYGQRQIIQSLNEGNVICGDEKTPITRCFWKKTASYYISKCPNIYLPSWCPISKCLYNVQAVYKCKEIKYKLQ